MERQKKQKPPQKPDTKYPVPPFPKQKQTPPGKEQKMKPLADHGEESYKGSGKLTGKKAIITGGDSGIGKAVAIAFAREGADVLISYLSDEETKDAQDSARYVEEAGQKAILVKGDIRKESHCKKIIAKAVKEFGQIDILVNNAAFQMARKDLADIPGEEWVKTFETNIHSMFYLSKAAEPYMKKGSNIINTTSVNAYNPSAVLLPYAATKGAIQNFTANLSQILLTAGKGIRVNAVAPGPIWTPLIPSTMPDPEKFGMDTPMGRPGQPVEVAPAYVFLASDEASYISGATIPVAGGRITI
ncbi:NAD(P)-dependent dehydrogenase (short-subunit alcohol dehydrogenase family) [Pedobacter africanus]|uniref:NAD(P)-dependent dehydrogenase (Short-subunit alcohol dehydrogenase family) n=1 Tax=Pedobacter africanus TaxID=151894 RepID=A0ACC6KU78_9SPHI|nr:SDR family oxidoreductase [Pedobacter africanus]MDR6782656.1 NAD(P)-dependent dehydrogenase (short-subunit alcohol dehydrogenase family) [Pedobacter africanus]